MIEVGESRRTGAATSEAPRDAGTVQQWLAATVLPISQAHAPAGICRAAVGLTGADVALLWEPDEELTELRLSGTHGVRLPPLTRVLEPSVSAAAGVFIHRAGGVLSGTFATGSLERPVPSFRPAEERTSVLEPMIGPHGIVGVLEVSWSRRLEDVPTSAIALIGLFARSAAGVIERARTTELPLQPARADQETALPDRGAWHEELAREIAHAKQVGNPLCIAVAELQNTSGDDSGTDAVGQISVAWQAELRDVGRLARLSDTTVALALPDAKTAAAAELVAGLKARTPDTVTVAIGIAEWHAPDTAAELMERASHALAAARLERDLALKQDADEDGVTGLADARRTRPPR